VCDAESDEGYPARPIEEMLTQHVAFKSTRDRFYETVSAKFTGKSLKVSITSFTKYWSLWPF
jgi:hypothetical protein